MTPHISSKKEDIAKTVIMPGDPLRAKYIAENFFGVQPSSYSFLEADGRRYLNATDKKFDLIILDVSNAEQQPYHLFTKESFQKISDRLNEKGILIIGSGNIIHNLRMVDFRNIDNIGYGFDWAIEARENTNNMI